jgi:8-oxo-dGTP pyrophosphatase MutT (NUDIX family)
MPERFKLVSAVHVFLLREGCLLLLRRANTGWGDGQYSVVAGHLEGDEEIKAAAIREAREEVGVHIDPSDLEVVAVMHRRSNDERIDFFLTANRWTGQVSNREPEKCDDIIWARPEQFPENMVAYVRTAFESYRRGKWFDSYGWSPSTGR